MTMPASTAEVAMKQLGLAAHVLLMTSPQTAKDVVSFQFKDVPLSDAMRHIADAVHGSWQREGRAYRLIRTSAQQNAEIRKEFDDKVDAIRKSIQRRSAALQQMHPWASAEADALAVKVQALIKSFNPKSVTADWYKAGTELGTKTPIGRALTKVVAALDPRELASLPQQMKAVWSSNPTPTQRALPNEFSQIADEFMKNQADWAGALEKYQIKAPTEGRATYYVGGLGIFKDNAGGNVSVILLSVTPQGPKYGFHCELAAYDATGRRVAQATTGLSNGADGVEPREAPSASGDEEKIKLEADAFVLIANRDKTPGRAKTLAAGLINKLIRPEMFDPLAIFLSPKLIQAARIKNVNMVAHLTDDMFSPDVFASTGETSVDEFLRKDVGTEGTVELKDGWLTVKPKRPSDSRSRQADRTAVGKYLRKLSTGRPLSLDDHAAIAVSLPDTVNNSLPMTMAGFIKRGNYDEYDPNMLRLYSGLTPEQKSAMVNSGLMFSSLSAEELQFVNRMIYAQNAQIEREPGWGPYGQKDQTTVGLFHSELMRESTECLPTGIPPQGLITLKVINSNSVFAFAADSDSDLTGMSGSPLDADAVGRLKYYRERRDLFPRANTFNLDQVLFGSQVNMTFTFQFTPYISMVQTLDDTNLDAFRKMTLDDLPDDFKKQVQSSYNRCVKLYANAKPGQLYGGTSAPPP
jgi:hypothetical protein